MPRSAPEILELNALETARFGIVAARVRDAGATPEEIGAAARVMGVQMATARVDVGHLPRVHALEAAGYRLMDTLVYYGRSLDALPSRVTLPAGTELRLASPDDVAAVGMVARAAFADYTGHYHADPRLGNDAADAAYVEWAETSTARASAETPVLLVEGGEHVAGFLTLRRNDAEEVEIVLNAVHPQSQGRGLYAALVTEALRLAGDMGAARVTVSTQINNYAVQRVWAGLGFTHNRSLYTFHKWFDDQSASRTG